MLFVSGCIYVPFPAHQLDNRQTDFRKFVGNPGSHKPIRIGAGTKDQVKRLLGPPIMTRGDSWTYVLATVGDLWVFPLFLAAQDAYVRADGIRLDFNHDGKLIKIEKQHQGVTNLFAAVTAGPLEWNVIRNLNHLNAQQTRRFRRPTTRSSSINDKSGLSQKHPTTRD